MSDIKSQLEQLKRDLETKNFREGEAKGLTQTIGDEINKQLAPAFKTLQKDLVDTVKSAFNGLESKIKVDMPDMQMPDIPAPVVNVPAPVVNVPAPVVNVSPTPVNIPPTKFPDPLPFPTDFALRGVNKSKPLPVMMMGLDGKPAQFGSGGVAGGRGDFFTIKDIQNSSGGSIIDNDGFVKVTGNFSVTAAGASSVSLVNADGNYYNSDNPLPISGTLSTSPFATYYASDAVGSVNIVDSITLPVIQSSGAIDSVYVTGVAASFFSDIQNPDGRVKVELPSGSSGLTDTELRATAVPMSQVSGAEWSTAAHLHAVDPSGAWEKVRTDAGISAGAVRVVHATDAITSVNVVGASSSMAVMLQNADGTKYDSANPLPVTAVTTQLSGATDSTNIVSFNGSAPATGLNETNNGVLRVAQMTDVVSSVNIVSSVTQNVTVTGATDSFYVYEARTTNPTAKSDGADIRPKTDDLGRTLTRMQARDLVKTAYVSLTTGTETTLLAGTAGAFNDLIMITATNNSTAATQLDIRPVTGGNIVHTMYLPASTGPIGFVPPVPWPQSDTGNNWTVDMPDQTGTTVYVSALFSQEI